MAGSEAQQTAIIAITRHGALQASRLREELGGRLYVPAGIARHVPDGRAQVFQGSVSAFLGEVFRKHRQIVLFVALGAAVRLLAPLVRDKRTDPAVVVVDDAGKYAISALSGHLGGANDLARQVAALLRAEPVITTATDVDCVSLAYCARCGYQCIDGPHAVANAATRAANTRALKSGTIIGSRQENDPMLRC